MITWMIYVALVSMVVAAAARSAETLARLIGYRVRWIWIGALTLTLGLATSSAMRDLSPRASIALPIAKQVASAPVMPHVPNWMSRVAGVVDRATQLLESPLQLSTQLFDRSSSTKTPFYLVATWIVATSLLTSLFATVAYRFRRARIKWPTTHVHDVAVRVSPSVGPVVIGLVRPEIVVPQWIFERKAEEQRLVVAHEHEHLRARDPLLLAFGWLVVLVAPWNLAVWYMVSRLRLAIELDCDARVLKRGAAPWQYGTLLIDVAQHASPLRLSALALADESSQLYQRILALRNRATPFARMRGAIAAAVSATLLVVACRAEPMSAPTPAAVATSRDSVSVTTAKPTSTAAVARALRTDSAVIPTVRSVKRAALGATDLAAATDTVVARNLPRSNTEAPIFYVDGVRSKFAGLRDMDPRLIESVEVIKGAGAIQAYGPDAVHGVVVVHTKKGSPTATPPN